MVNKLSPKFEERGLASSYIKAILILITFIFKVTGHSDL
jgi:hypothetical protein